MFVVTSVMAQTMTVKDKDGKDVVINDHLDGSSAVVVDNDPLGFGRATSGQYDHQLIPGGRYIAQPNGSGIVVVWANFLDWPYRYTFTVDFDDGEIRYMSYAGGSADMGTEFKHEFYPGTGKNTFKNLEEWKKFAFKVDDEFSAIIPQDEIKKGFVEKEPYVFIGRSVLIGDGAALDDLQTLVFQRGSKFVSVAKTLWMGKIPKVGDSVILGQDGHNNLFFAAKKKEGYVVGDDALKEIANEIGISKKLEAEFEADKKLASERDGKNELKK